MMLMSDTEPAPKRTPSTPMMQQKERSVPAHCGAVASLDGGDRMLRKSIRSYLEPATIRSASDE